MKLLKERAIIVLIGLTFLVSCRSESTVDEFVDFVSTDESFKKVDSVGGYIYTCIYRPPELICLLEVAKSKRNKYKFEPIEFNNELKKYENAYYFDLIIHTKDHKNLLMEGIRNQEEYAQRIAYLTFSLQNSCYLLLDQEDSLKAIACNFSNTFGNDPDIRLTFVFPKSLKSEVKNDNLVLVLNNSPYNFENKKMKFHYNINNINNSIPTIIE